MSKGPFILIVKCADRRGVVAAIAGYLTQRNASIIESSQFNDAPEKAFYMRVTFRQEGPTCFSLEELSDGLKPIAETFGMHFEVHDGSIRPRVLIAVSRFGHCLYDLLHRWRSGLLPIDIPAVISNHEDMRSFVEWNGLPYHYLPVTKDTRCDQEAQIMDLVRRENVDLVVLARYMQILSPELCAALSGRCINIHHSFLPSFKGAKPYHQAHARGVKIIGATAHYVTSDLDEGPIIEQGVERVTHAQTPADLVEIGRDIECAVLARAVNWHVQRRVLRQGNKTIVFS